MKMDKKTMDEWQSIENVPDALKLKTIYMMIIRSTMLAISSNFHMMALINQLHDKGVIDKAAVEAEAAASGQQIQNELFRMQEEMEKDINKEARDIYVREQHDAFLRAQKEAPGPDSGSGGGGFTAG
jgi:hypothetical protein